MGDAVVFFRTYEVWIYLLLGLVGLIFLRKFALAWQELQGAVFGLERENAQSRLNQAAGMLMLVLALMMAEFVLVSFVLPSAAMTAPLFTPTLNLLSTPTTTLPAAAVGTPIDNAQLAVTAPAVPPQTDAESRCVAGQVAITTPQNGSEVNGIVDVIGSANIPNFGFYKLEMRRLGDTSWLTILAGNEIKQEATLGSWNTTLIAGGEYQLSLVVVDNQGVAQPPCIVQIRVAAPVGTPTP